MSEPTSTNVPSSRGATTVAHDHGGDGPTLVICHATGFHARCYDPLVAAFEGKYRCVAIDLRGHGDATEPDDYDMNWRGMADDVHAVVDALGLGDGLLAVGHSMGGATIMLSEIGRPGLFRKAWLFEPIIVPDAAEATHQPSPLVQSARRRREVFDSYDAAFDRYSSRPPFNMVDPAALRAYVDHGFESLDDGTVRLKCRGETEARTFENSNTGIESQLATVATQVTVLGSGDGELPAQIASQVADAIPNGRFEPVPDLTHFGPFQDPTQMARSIEAAFDDE